jgi:uncharacterized protein (TIRG00374 family)
VDEPAALASTGGGHGVLARRIVTAAVVLAGLAFVAAQHDVSAAGHAVRTADREWLAVAGVATMALLANQALLHAAAQRATRLPTRAFGATLPAWAAICVNQLTKSGGMAGLGMLVVDGDRRRLRRGAVVAAYAMVATLTELAFAATLGVALLAGWLDGHLTAVEIVASAVFAAYAIARISVMAVAMRSRDTVRRIYAAPRRLLALVRRRPAARSDTHAADELHDALSALRAEPLRWVPAAAHATALEALGVVEMWAVIAAVGGGRSIIVALVAYAVSTMFAIVGVLPAGLGFVEVSLGAVLVSFGLPAPTAVAAVLLYRLVELWIPVAVGALAATRVRRWAVGAR